MHPEKRKDPIVDRWVILAPDRAARPHDPGHGATGLPLGADHAQRASQPCPFCAGNEHLTPPAVYQRPAKGDWTIRVVPNRYPAVRGELIAQHAGEIGSAGVGESLLVSQPAVGAHEVIIESPDHVVSTGALAESHLREVLCTYRDRLLACRAMPWAKAALLFKNVGPAAGASLAHLHSQLIALPWVPGALAEEVEQSNRYHQRHGRCVFCDLIASELAAGVRIVLCEPPWVALTAYAGRQPFETWVLSSQHGGWFEDLTQTQLKQLAGFLRRVVRRVETVLTTVAYNLILHSGPFDTHRGDHYHWHIEIVPRVGQLAGFEWGGGTFIQSVAPERAATMLRDLRD